MAVALVGRFAVRPTPPYGHPSQEGKPTQGSKLPDGERKRLIRLIHVAKGPKGLRLSEDAYRDVLEGATGLRSCSHMNDGQLIAAYRAFRALGFTPTGGDPPRPAGTSTKRRKRKKLSPKSKGTAASNTQAAKIRALWITLYRLGAVEDRHENAINAYCKRMTGMDRLEWAGKWPQHCNTVIEGMKDWVTRELTAIMDADTIESPIADAALHAFSEGLWDDFNGYLDRLDGGQN